MQGSSDSKATLGFDPDALRRAIHLAYLLKRCIKENIHTIETTQEAEDKWVEEIIGQRGPRRAFLESCTPSYYNQEGRDTPATALNDIYGAARSHSSRSSRTGGLKTPCTDWRSLARGTRNMTRESLPNTQRND